MKPALWLLLLLCAGANIAATTAFERSPAQVAFSAVSGVGALGALTALALLRGGGAAGGRGNGRRPPG